MLRLFLHSIVFLGSVSMCMAAEDILPSDSAAQQPLSLCAGIQGGCSLIAINELQSQLARSSMPSLSPLQVAGGGIVSIRYNGWRLAGEYLHSATYSSSGSPQGHNRIVTFTHERTSFIFGYDIPIAHSFAVSLSYAFSWNDYTIDLNSSFSPKVLHESLPPGLTDWDYMWESFPINNSSSDAVLVKNGNISFSPQATLYWQIDHHIILHTTVEYSINASPYKYWSQQSDTSFLMSGGAAGMTMNAFSVFSGIQYVYSF